MKTETLPKKRYVHPQDREKISGIMESVCKMFEVEKAYLLSSTDRGIVKLRQYCFYLIKENTDMNETAVGEIFSVSKSSVLHGIGQIDVHKDIYVPILHDLRKIVEHVNNFSPKTSEWHLHSINIQR